MDPYSELLRVQAPWSWGVTVGPSDNTGQVTAVLEEGPWIRKTEKNTYHEINSLGVMYPERRDRAMFRKEAKNQV